MSRARLPDRRFSETFSVTARASPITPPLLVVRWPARRDFHHRQQMRVGCGHGRSRRCYRGIACISAWSRPRHATARPLSRLTGKCERAAGRRARYRCGVAAMTDVSAISAEELREAWRAVANAKLVEFRKQCWRLAGLVRSGIVEEASRRRSPLGDCGCSRPRARSRRGANRSDP